MARTVRMACAAMALLIFMACRAAGAESTGAAEWGKTLEAARKEGKIVIAIPPASELRKHMEAVLRQKFGLDAELVPAPGPKNASRIAAEQKAGVRYFDAEGRYVFPTVFESGGSFSEGVAWVRLP